MGRPQSVATARRPPQSQGSTSDRACQGSPPSHREQGRRCTDIGPYAWCNYDCCKLVNGRAHLEDMVQTIVGSSRHIGYADVCYRPVSSRFHMITAEGEAGVPVLAALARLGVTKYSESVYRTQDTQFAREDKPASGRTTTWASHCKSCIR